MKKAVLILAALLLVSSFVFAQDAGIKIGAWGRGLFIAAMGGTDPRSEVVASWGPGGARIGMTISGTSPNVGFQADFNVDNNKVSTGDQQKIWVKPIDMLTLQVGRIYDDTLRGNAGAYGAWNWFRYNFMVGEDTVFGRMGVTGQKNFVLSLAPVEGLYINAGLGGATSIMPDSALTSDVIAGIQAGAGYTIANIGTIRAQYVGINKDAGNFNAAFKLTAVEKLTVDAGAIIPVALTDAGTSLVLANIALGASYGLDALTINAMADVIMFTSDSGADPSFQFGAGVDYSLGGGLGLTADFRYQNDNSGVTSGSWGGMAGVTMGFSNGLIGVALELTNANFATNWGTEENAKTNADDIAWAIPVRFEYWF